MFSKRLTCGSVLALSLLAIGGCPQFEDVVLPGVRVSTSMGDFVIELDAEAAPVTVVNFLNYADAGFYDGTIFHRVIAGFVVQGGGLTPELMEKETNPPIVNESLGGLPNLRGAVAMARTSAPDSATAQFYINVADNPDLDATAQRLGYTVFGRVVEGMDVVDAIAAVETETRDAFSDVPVEDVVITGVERTGVSAGTELTPESQVQLEWQAYQVQVVLREALVQALSFALGGLF